MSRRAFLGGAAALGAVPLLAACGGGGSAGGGGNAKELVFWNFYGPTDKPSAQSDWFVNMVKEWNADNEVKVKLHYLPTAEYITGTPLQTAFSAGEGPDIFLISPGDFLRYSNANVLQDLTPHLRPDAIADYVDGVLDTRKVNGKIYGLPMEIEPLALYYGIDAFEKAGLSEGDIPTTWDQLLNVAEKLTDKDRFGLLFETIPGYYQNFTWYPFMWMGGSSAVPADGLAGFDSPGAIAALDLWQKTIRAGIAPKKPRGDGAGNVVANLVSGSVAIQQTGTWALADLQQQAKDFKYGVFKLPTPQGGTYTTDMGGWAFVANAKGKNPEAAAKFIAWALGSMDAGSVERGRQWSTVVKTTVPPRKSVQKAAEEKGAFQDKAFATFIKDVAPGGRPEPRYPPEVYKAVSDAIQACQLGSTAPATAAADAAAKIDAFLKTYKGAPIL
ncbi:ABC transporter substrate-binding protein [Spongiactinospora rosea]|uniref:ABC transporter substrate-binding protein n=1 Tax=Spongiactinospora rosea TaxID=2248750 RepID=UPI0018F2A32F|nr:sugar ABC transporter substrate-binding protein [Spongiactinospora rosea]